MQMNQVLKVSLASLILTSMAIQNGYAQAGQSGLAFLKLGVSARGMAMGDAMSATVSGAPATYYNPAGLLNSFGVSTAQIMFMHKEWIQDTRTEFLGSAISLDTQNAIGFSINSTTVSEIEIRTRPGIPEGTFTARNFALGASYAQSISDDLSIGLTGKALYQKILVDESSGFAFDAGAQYRTSIENLTLGLAIANLGSMGGFRSGKTELPSLLRVGPAYTYDLEAVNAKLALASDLLYIFPEHKSYVNAGGECTFNQIIAARFGYQFGSEGRGLAGGIGVLYGMFLLDYAYTHLGADLGNSHTISLALNL